MKTTLLSFFLFPSVLMAQNLVPNPSFEDYTQLPTTQGEWSSCVSWTNAGGLPVGGYYGDPDYFHLMGGPPVQLPSTPPAYVQPFAGDAIMGFLGYHEPYQTTGDIREYLMVPLTEPLDSGTNYSISFWITNGESTIGHKFSCDGIGVNFSMNPLNQGGPSYINQPAEVEIAGDQWSTTWEKITLYYQADSAYTHLTIGNFNSDANTNITLQITDPVPFNGAYYFIDSVDVHRHLSSSEVGENTLPEISIYPNPAQDIVHVSIHSAEIELLELQDLSGAVILRQQVTGMNTQMDVSQLPKGLYFIHARNSAGIRVQTRKLIKL